MIILSFRHVIGKIILNDAACDNWSPDFSLMLYRRRQKWLRHRPAEALSRSDGLFHIYNIGRHCIALIGDGIEGASWWREACM